jgi:hypothetical protein
MLDSSDQSASLGIEFLGHTINVQGVKSSIERVYGVRVLPKPTLVTAVQSFISMVNYFPDHIHSLSSHLIPLFELRRKRNSIENFLVTDAASIPGIS